jgi:hypothetical protein
MTSAAVKFLSSLASAKSLARAELVDMA